MPSEPQIADNPREHRYEMRIDGQVAAIAAYRLAGDTLTFTHTEVQPGHEGQGLGSKIAKYALDDVKRRGIQGVAQCKFIADYVKKHPEYADAVRVP